jgi:hypothetical protein
MPCGASDPCSNGTTRDLPIVEDPNRDIVSGGLCNEPLRARSVGFVFRSCDPGACLNPVREPGRLIDVTGSSCDALLPALGLVTRKTRGAGVFISNLALVSGVGSRLYACPYPNGKLTLTARFAADSVLEVFICTTRGGVVLRLSSGPPCLGGDVRRTTFIPGSLLGVSAVSDCIPVDIPKCTPSRELPSRAGEIGSATSARSACVTFENLIAGGGSSSESLSLPTLMLLIMPG